jgi:release factor glutamine methyltransferase
MRIRERSAVSQGRDDGRGDARAGFVADTGMVEWRLAPRVTVGRALAAARQRLKEAGCEKARLDAEVLLAHALGVSRSWLYAHPERELLPEEAAAFESLVKRRAQHEPVAYLIGHRAFYGLDFSVDRRVLIPRPETEILVERAIEVLNWQRARFRQIGITRTVKVADVGTGCGAIAVTLAVKCPDIHIYAIDISADALEVAAQNVWRYGVGDQVTLLQGDLLAPLPEPVDLITANLPYVPESDWAILAPDIVQYEPRLALDGGPDGLALIERLLAQAAVWLLPEGVILLEIGCEQGEVVRRRAFHYFPWATVEIIQDYAGLDRVIRIIT